MGKKRRYEQGSKMMHEGCKMNEKMKLKRKEKKKHLKQNATKQKEHDINLGMT